MKLKQVIEGVPIPFCGVALAVAALGPTLEPSAAWAWPLCGALSCAFYLVGLANLVVCLRLPFYPTYAAMTFPFVIAAASLKFAALLPGLAFVSLVARVQVVIVCLAVFYVLVRYAAFLFGR